MHRTLASCLLMLVLASPAFAAGIEGAITDRTGGVLQGARVRLLNVATGQETSATTDQTGRYRFADLKVGIYRLATSFLGFSDASRTVVIEDDAQSLRVDFELELGSVKADVTVTAARGERDIAVVPLRADTVMAETIRELAPASTGDALVSVPGVTPVGSGPFQTRPRLRGLDSTRVLVLVDGERLNNARTATDRAGVEVGLVDLASVENIEVLGGAGSVLYGTDALSGTINIITNRPRFSDGQLFTAGFDGFYSSNEDGRRGTVLLGASDRRWALSFRAGGERFDNYKAGKDFNESSQRFLDDGTINRADTIDDNFGYHFDAFPDPFNAPFTRTTNVVPSSGMKGTSVNFAGLAMLTPSQTVEVKYQNRDATDIGFPDFDQPYFFQQITLPWSRLDKTSVSYSVTNVTSWLPKFTATGYYQRQDRLLRNAVPVQIPVPSAGTFFPINVERLQILSDTRQQVWTPGVDLQATFMTRPNNVLTAGATIFRDRSADVRTSSTTTTTIGQVTGSFGPFGPVATGATVFATPVFNVTTFTAPVRVPDATFRDIGVFVQDEWDATSVVRLTGGIRVDGYAVRTEETPGYDITTFTTGAVPPIDPTTLPDVKGQSITRTAFTGEAGIVVRVSDPVNLFSHYVHSYRHPNLEELLFSGMATAGSIVPNIQVEPETGHNVDVGVRLSLSHLTGSVSYFNNTYSNFISTEPVAAVTGQRGVTSVSQAINLAKVRIQGVEAEANMPFTAGGLVWLPSGTVAFNRGTVLEGTSPLTKASLAGEPQDNITPLKMSFGLRVSDERGKCWIGYSVRAESDVTRISPLLNESPFLIAQDLLALDGFAVHRAAVGYDWRRGNQLVGLTAAVDNLTDRFYREHFQFAPARGRTFTLSLTVRGTK